MAGMIDPVSSCTGISSLTFIEIGTSHETNVGTHPTMSSTALVTTKAADWILCGASRRWNDQRRPHWTFVVAVHTLEITRYLHQLLQLRFHLIL